MAGRAVLPGDLAPCGHRSDVGSGRLCDQTCVNDLVVAALADLAAMDWSGHLRDGRRTADLGAPTSWQEPDRYGGHAARAHAGHGGSVSLGPTSVLRLGRAARAGRVVDRGELVSACDRRIGHWPVNHPDAD